MTDLGSLANPYNFSRPVADHELFAGRERELREIAYYLDQAKLSNRPMSLALLGERAAGKSSLLNATEHEAKRRGILTARIDLNEGDAETQLLFFYKLFDSLMTSACEANHFGGIHGKTYETYLDVTQTYAIPDSKTFCPFLFPLNYARASAANNHAVPVSDAVFRRDLRELRKVVATPIAILIDEGNVLSSSRVLLEKLRNIFDNEDGYMLVITGTPALFPMIDEVFSPIIRSFKKLEVKPFESKDETRDCIQRPLIKLGLDPNELFDFTTLREVAAIHDVSGGRPYEIQLLCHMLFRRVQEGHASRMTLNLSVLEDVRRELERTQESSSRPVLANVMRLSRDQLKALRVLFRAGRDATLVQAWAAEYVFNAATPWTQTRLEEEAARLSELGLVALDGSGRVVFQGDEFDKLYLKYFARERQVPLVFPTYPTAFYWENRLREALGLNESDIVAGAVWHGFADGELDLADLLAELEKEEPSRENLLLARFLLDEVYRLLLRHETASECDFMLAKIDLPQISLRVTAFPSSPDHAGSIGVSESRMEGIVERARSLGGEAMIRVHRLAIPDNAKLAPRLSRIGDEEISRKTARAHLDWAVELYMGSSSGRAQEHVRRAILFEHEWTRDDKIKIGYMLSETDMNTARHWLEQAEDGPTEGLEFPLACFDLAILDARGGDLEQAEARLRRCIEALSSMPPQRRTVGCVHTCTVKDSNLEFQERMCGDDGEDLLPIAIECEQAIRAVKAVRC